MKDNIFAHWLKEFCSLVFIQTIQAFIFAIVMSLIISVMTPDNTNAIERADLVAATGVIAVIALASISKLEELVKKIFGVQSSITDPGMRGGMKSLATTMMAASLAKRVLDNAGKVGGGIAGAIGVSKDKVQAKNRLARNLAAASPQADSAGSGGDGAPQLTADDYMEKAYEAKSKGDMEAFQRNRGIAEGLNKAGSSSSSGESRQEKINKALDEYEDKMRELSAKRRKNILTAVGGGVESVGAAIGGTTGALVGIAGGEPQEIVRNTLAGMGAGDALGAAAMKPVQGANDFATYISDYSRETDKLVKSASQMSDTAREAINSRRTNLTKYNEAKRQLNKAMQEHIDAGNLE